MYICIYVYMYVLKYILYIYIYIYIYTYRYYTCERNQQTWFSAPFRTALLQTISCLAYPACFISCSRSAKFAKQVESVSRKKRAAPVYFDFQMGTSSCLSMYWITKIGALHEKTSLRAPLVVADWAMPRFRKRSVIWGTHVIYDGYYLNVYINVIWKSCKYISHLYFSVSLMYLGNHIPESTVYSTFLSYLHDSFMTFLRGGVRSLRQDSIGSSIMTL